MTSAVDPFAETLAREQAQPVFALTTPTREDTASVVADATRWGPAVRCFLSPFDALLDMLFLRRLDPNAIEAVVRSNRLPPEIFYSSWLRQRSIVLHVAWLADGQRLVAADDGRLIRVARDQPAQWRVWHRIPETISIESGTWAVLDQLHEYAGLFAWRDTLKIARQWLATPAAAEAALNRAVAALASIEPIVVPADRAGQLALYDPEAGYWHFVPRGTIV
ncbi:hypothetical protein FCJ61_05455 [Burkholderia metallica]|uniref:hypothetical protein n=1 Tax=Burkholderia metallica TaxID=488729 RepID=UPI00157AE541|nr:hypothetical protein [Burkholderia metallica]NTZ82469.1 hypothetical protein [Burkholderia metallica]